MVLPTAVTFTYCWQNFVEVVGFQIVRHMTMKISFVWNVKPYNLVDRPWRFGGTNCLHHEVAFLQHYMVSHPRRQQLFLSMDSYNLFLPCIIKCIMSQIEITCNMCSWNSLHFNISCYSSGLIWNQIKIIIRIERGCLVYNLSDFCFILNTADDIKILHCIYVGHFEKSALYTTWNLCNDVWCTSIIMSAI